jgi:hypothetical protein
MADIPQRKYTMMKGQGAGDWLLPGNDGKTLWRLSKEDNALNGVEADWGPWCLWRWHRTIGKLGIDMDALGDWSQWDLEEQGHLSRENAIRAALKLELPRPKPKRPVDPRPAGQILVDAYAYEVAGELKRRFGDLRAGAE